MSNQTPLIGKTIAVYCASSAAIDPVYFEAATQLGTLIGQQGAKLVYGGTNVGLMGAVANAVLAAGGPVTGVIPNLLYKANLTHPNLTELILTDGMRERKAVMEEQANAFIVLPGGNGTWEELLEVLTLKQLGYHNKAIVLLNTNNFYAPLLQLFQQAVDQHFAKPGNLSLLQTVSTPDEAIEYLLTYQPPTQEPKWVLPRPEQSASGEVPGTE